jgi:transcriptional regulator with XRE-family HTH domain
VADETSKIGERIRQRREEAGLSISKLGELTRISKGYLWSVEQGKVKSRPSGDTLYKIAGALGTTMSDLLGRKVLGEDDEPEQLPPGLTEFAKRAKLPSRDVRMLAHVNFRGEQPTDPEDWAFVYQAIQRSVARSGNRAAAPSRASSSADDGDAPSARPARHRRPA